MTVAELLRNGAAALTARPGLPDPARESRWLLAATLWRPESWLLAHGDEAVGAEAASRFRRAIDRRLAGEPAHYIVGTCPFWGRDFLVTPDVLIPRPETELIVQTALRLGLPGAPRVLDVGTGSGCLAVTLALELPAATVYGSEVSLTATEVARENVERHRAGVRLVCGDLARHVRGPFDLVVANLPYVPAGQLSGLAPEIRDFEPQLALTPGETGTELIALLLRDLPRLLLSGGYAILELGAGQADLLAESAAVAGLDEACRVRDLHDAERVLVLRRPVG